MPNNGTLVQLLEGHMGCEQLKNPDQSMNHLLIDHVFGPVMNPNQSTNHLLIDNVFGSVILGTVIPIADSTFLFQTSAILPAGVNLENNSESWCVFSFSDTPDFVSIQFFLYFPHRTTSSKNQTLVMIKTE